ncbi:conjugal transfer protein [Streptococcus dysgalactiae subsp. dysgalactiae]|nr:conjugal transfer protein [Streptococcus dysgalactiae subsp. dysgalactiae]
MERKDKEVYNYTTALKQPTWIQKITENYSLPNAIKLSTFAWGIFFYLFFMYLVLKFLKGLPLPIPFWGALLVVPSWYLALIFADLKIEEQSLSRFFKDYLKMYRKYGLKRKTHYLNDGIWYLKPEYMVKKGR